MVELFEMNDFYLRYANERLVLELDTRLFGDRFSISRWRIFTRALSVHAQSIRLGSYVGK